MSEKPSIEGRVEITEKFASVNRRRVLKTIGAAGGAAAFSPLSQGIATAEEDKKTNWDEFGSGDVSVTGMTPLPSGQKSEIEPVLSATSTRKLKRSLTGQGLQELSTSSYTVTTDSEEMNSLTPILTMTIFNSESNDKSKPRMGSIHTLSLEADDGTRKPAAEFALTLEGDLGEQSKTQSDTKLKAYFFSDGDVIQQGEAKVPQKIISENNTTVRANGNDYPSCWECNLYISAVCSTGAAAISVGGCASACAAALIFYVHCTAICSVIASAVGTITCALGAREICNDTPAC